MSETHELELLERLDKLTPLANWIKGILAGAFALGAWVAMQQASINSLTRDMIRVQTDIQRSSDWESEQREASAAMKQQLTSLEQSLTEIKEILRSKR